MEVDVAKINGPDENRIGLLCRFVGDNYYFFMVSSDGYYGIGKVEDGVQSLIGTDAMPPSEAIKQGQATNHIRADCIGSALLLYANDVLIQADPSIFHKLHHGGSRHRLGDRSNIHQRIRAKGLPFSQVRPPIPLRPGHLAALDNARRQAHQMMDCHLLNDEIVQPGHQGAEARLFLRSDQRQRPVMVENQNRIGQSIEQLTQFGHGLEPRGLPADGVIRGLGAAIRNPGLKADESQNTLP
jgi:hypothetical protein